MPENEPGPDALGNPEAVNAPVNEINLSTNADALNEPTVPVPVEEVFPEQPEQRNQTTTTAAQPPKEVSWLRRTFTREGRQQHAENVRVRELGELSQSLHNLNEQRTAQQELLNGATDEVERRELQHQLEDTDHQIARNVIDRMNHGEQINQNEWSLLAHDAQHFLERSAVAELMLARQGFRSFQDAMVRMGAGSAQAGELVVSRDSSTRYNWVREHLAKLGVGAGASLATLGVVSILGGPVSIAAAGVGIAGGAAGRLFGEYLRSRSLHKEVGEGNERKTFGDKAASDLLGMIADLGKRAEALESAGDDQEKRSTALLGFLKAAQGREEASVKEFHQLDRKYARVKGCLGFLGAVGGTVTYSFLHHGAQVAQEIAQAKQHGVRIIHDAAGNGHVVSDPSVGHEVYQTNDSAWRYMIEQKDVTGPNGAIANVAKWGGDYRDWFHFANIPNVSNNPHLVHLALSGQNISVPHDVGGLNLLHSGVINSDGIYNALAEQAFHKALIYTAETAAAAGATELGIAGYNRLNSPTQLRRDNQPFADMINAQVSQMTPARTEASRTAQPASEEATGREARRQAEDQQGQPEPEERKDEPRPAENKTENKEDFRANRERFNTEVKGDQESISTELVHDETDEGFGQKEVDLPFATAATRICNGFVERINGLEADRRDELDLEIKKEMSVRGRGKSGEDKVIIHTPAHHITIKLGENEFSVSNNDVVIDKQKDLIDIFRDFDRQIKTAEA